MEAAPTETERAAVAERLLTSSLRTSYDPTVEIDWDAPHTPGAYWLPPHRSSLYGTPLWEQLSEEQRVELTSTRWPARPAPGCGSRRSSCRC